MEENAKNNKSEFEDDEPEKIEIVKFKNYFLKI